ncbi:MAG: tRNA (adenine-N1)-methyltransferase [Synergistaceae bacterium]|nr:tRNA (adenine-N1)-methyltransferase [Synergistaceae bacterium]
MLKEGDLVSVWNPKKGDTFIVKIKPGQSLGTHFGQIRHSELMEHDYGEGVYTPKGDIYYLLRPTLAGFTRRLKRNTQIIFPKDAGFILQHLNICPGSTVVECGTGSGSLCCTFAHFVGDEGKVCTYDRREDFSELARKNAEKWGVDHRIEFNVRELSEGFKERNADAVFLDVPTPWEYIDKAYEALAPGNHLGVLVPTANQISATLEALNEFNFVDVNVLEIMLRYYKTDPKRIRPEDTMIGHTGYLIFAVKTLPLPEKPELPEAETAKADDVKDGQAEISEPNDTEGEQQTI